MTERTAYEPGSCERCGEYGIICLNGQIFLCWEHYCEAVRVARELRRTTGEAMTERTAYRLSEVRAALGISRSTLYRWIEDGKIKVTRVCGRPYVKLEDHPAPPTISPTVRRGIKRGGTGRPGTAI